MVDCRSWQPVNYVSMTDRIDQTAGMTLAEREGALNRLEGWKQVRGGSEPSGGMETGEGGPLNRLEGWKQVRVGP